MGREGQGGKRGITSSRHNVGGHGEGCTTKRRQAVILYHLTTLMDSDSNGVCGGDLIMGESSNHNVAYLIVA